MTRKETRRFIGMVTYLAKFSRETAELLALINAITGKAREWVWDLAQQDAFEKVKIMLSQAPVLVPFDVAKQHRVSAHASKYALGAAVLQRVSETHWGPVEYSSRKMTEAETRYAQIEKESLAITWVCDYYLVGRKFQIETDHSPLVKLLGVKDLGSLLLRVQRFKLRHMHYDGHIPHAR